MSVNLVIRIWSVHEKVSVTFDKRETFGIFMQYEIEWMYTLMIAFKFICSIFSFIKLL